MNNTTNNIKEAEIIKQLLSIFSEIDDRLISLHECSSNDFLAFNERLKQYHSVVKTINKNTDEILKIIDSDRTSDFYTQLNFLHYQIKIYIETFEKQIDTHILQFENLLKLLNELYLPLKNYKQNLITLKYLIANLRINLLYEYNKYDSNLFNDDIKNFDVVIKKVIDIYPEFEKELEDLKVNILLTLMSFKNFKDSNAFGSSVILNQTDYTLSLLNAKHSSIVKQAVAIREKTAVCSQNVSNIIINLQFHDIIRQKIEHIQATNKKILKELSIASENSSIDFPTLASKIKDVADLQIAQLTHTNQKYQSAIEAIIQQFSDIASNLTSSFTISSLANQKNDNSLDVTFNEIEEELLSGVNILQNLSQAIDDFWKKIDYIKSTVQNIEKLNSDLQNQNQVLLNFVNTVIKKLNTKELENEFGKISKYIKDTENFQRYSELIKDTITKIVNLTKEIQDIYKIELPDENFKAAMNKTNSQIKELINELINTNKSISDHLITNYNLSNEVINDIRTSVKNVQYYDYFEKVMEFEIIVKLNNLYNLFKENQPESNAYKRAEFLSEFQKHYTMNSERSIHVNVEEGKPVSDNTIQDDNIVKIDDDDSIEFF